MPSISQAALFSEFNEIASQEYGDKFSTYQEELDGKMYYIFGVNN